MAPIFENTDLLAHTCGLLDAADIARLCQSCRFVPEHIRDVKTIKFLSTMRSDAVLGNLSTIERLALVESLRECSTCIAFKVFSCDLLEACLAPLQALRGLDAAAPVLFRVDRGALRAGGSARRGLHLRPRTRPQRENSAPRLRPRAGAPRGHFLR